MKSALITGITGQDGSYLTEFLLSKNYKVYGLVRRTSHLNIERIEHLLDKIKIFPGDLTDLSCLVRIIEECEPDELYNLAAQSFVYTSWEQPLLTAQVTAVGVANVLEAIRIVNPKIKFYQASSSEMFGKVQTVPQNEKTPFYPRSPYGVSKLFGHWLTVNYRESFGLFGCSGILFNHESPRRGKEFVTRKISYGVARIKQKKAKKLHLGNLDASRDWGFAGDYVKAMWLMLQQEKPEDYVIATGETHTVKEFAEIAFKRVGLNWKDYVVVDKELLRPAEVDYLLGDAKKGREKLGWKPEVNFQQLVEMMVDADMELVAREK
jgi:GDPmannose 4,6-dehydratase